MNPQLAALFATHKTAIMAAGAAAAVGLGLWTKKKQGAAATTSAGSTTSIPGTIPAAAVVAPAIGGAYDSSSYDLYNALQSEFQQQAQGSGVTTAPSPVASALYSPTGNGNIAWYDNGAYEVEGDGSLYEITSAQLQQAMANGANPQKISGAAPTNSAGSYYGYDQNLATRAASS